MNSSKDKKIVLIMLISFAVLAVLYASQYVYSKSTGKIEFEYALKYTQQEKLNVKGFAVRDENRVKNGKNVSILYKDNNKIYVPVLTDSANVGMNDTIAITFKSEEQAENYLASKELEAKLEDLENLKSQGELNYVNVVYLNSSIYSSVDDYVGTVNGNDLSSLDDSVSSFISKVSTKQIATGSGFDIDSRIKEVKKELKAVKKTFKKSGEIKSSYSGYFVGNVDGYEAVKSYEDVKNKKVAVNEGSKLINSEKVLDGNAFGKIIAQHTWYFIFDTSITDASVIKTGYYVTVDFPEKGIEDITMKVYSVSELNGDTITVVLQCTSMNEDLANLRIEDAAITVKDYNGFRISSDAIAENDEGIKGVYVVLGNYVKFTPISISYYGDDYVIADRYIVYKKDEEGNKVVDEEATENYRSLGLYDKIIVKGMHIEDGMLIS
ncbi:MAG: hypothetical protein IKK60_05865 [Clostridia bacterium]|nr:hypothetical protein [Clostridia bacterium]